MIRHAGPGENLAGPGRGVDPLETPVKVQLGSPFSLSIWGYRLMKMLVPGTDSGSSSTSRAYIGMGYAWESDKDPKWPSSPPPLQAAAFGKYGCTYHRCHPPSVQKLNFSVCLSRLLERILFWPRTPPAIPEHPFSPSSLPLAATGPLS